jgi:hypothetical protein
MTLPAHVPAVWLAASVAANVILFLLFTVFALSRKSERPAAVAVGRDAEEVIDNWETRIERVDVLWFPTVTFSPSAKRVLKTAPGVPHCKNCARALSLSKDGNKGWVCPACSQSFPETLADVSILDMISKQAVKHFLERHPGFQTK